MVYFDHILYTYLFNCPATGAQNGDEALPIIILAVPGLLVKMLINLEMHHIYFDQILHAYTISKIVRENNKEKIKKKIYKEKNIGHAWIRTHVRQAVGLKESFLDHSATTQEQFTYISQEKKSEKLTSTGIL